MFSICSVWNLSTNINSACYKKNVETELITFFRILPDEVIEVPVNVLSHSYCFLFMMLLTKMFNICSVLNLIITYSC